MPILCNLGIVARLTIKGILLNKNNENEIVA
ncbi:hypothetical protein HNR33_000577 [Brassicibacter mesophilus]